MTVNNIKKAVLVVSFGTSYQQTRERTINRIAREIDLACDEYEIRQAFTSQMVINKIKEQEDLEIDNVKTAVQKLADEGFQTLIVQPTHIMAGLEYDKMCDAVDTFSDRFDAVVIGRPLLCGPEDYDQTVSLLAGELTPYYTPETSIVLMGHGTEHSSNAVYPKLEECFRQKGMTNYYVGTVEAKPGLPEVLSKVKENGTTKVVLVPFMIVAGDHATNDMAGDDEDSWKNRFEEAGYEVTCILQGLGEYTGIRKLFVNHVQDSISTLSD